MNEEEKIGEPESGQAGMGTEPCNESETPKLEWPDGPLDFHKCPNCGSERRVCEEVLKAEQAKGKLLNTKRTFIMRSQSLLTATQQFLMAPVVFGFYDACADCGTLYMVHAQCKQITSNIDMQKIASSIDITKGRS